MKHSTLKTALALIALLGSGIATYAQKSTLEISFEDYLSNPPAGPSQGPSIAPQTHFFSQQLVTPPASPFTPYSPQLRVTTSFRNQTYTGLNLGTMSTGLAFGAEATDHTALTGPTVAGPHPQQPQSSNLMVILAAGQGSYYARNDKFTASPTEPAGTGIEVGDDGSPTTNGAVALFATVEPLHDQGLDKAGRYLYGEMTVTFSRPVKNPVIHLAGLGGSANYTTGGNFKSAYFSTELELATPGLTLSKLSGTSFLTVTGTQILNNAAIPNGYSEDDPTNPAGNDGNGFSTIGSASGSILVTGTVTEVVFRVYVRGSAASEFAFSYDMADVGPPSSTNLHDPVAGDYFKISYSLDKPAQQLSGIVFLDADGLKDNNIATTGTTTPNPQTNVNTLLQANLIDNTGRIVATTPVSSTGVYLFDIANPGTFTVQLTTTPGTVGSTPPATQLPAGWINTGEQNGLVLGSDGAPNGNSAPVTVNSGAIVENVNFGIEQPPVSNDKIFVVPNSAFTPTPSVTIGGVPTQRITSTDPALNNPSNVNGNLLSGNDPEDCAATACGSGSTFTITSLLPSTVVYYNGSPYVLRTEIPNFNPALLDIYGVNGSGTTANPIGFNYTLTDRAGVPSVPTIYRITTATPLPVTWGVFAATKNGSKSDLTWTTLKEVNTRHFVIERSVDGRNFTSIGQVAAAGNSDVLRSYSSADLTPAAGINYYRLRQVDLDGKATYSEVRQLRFDANGNVISIALYPVPVRTVLTVQGAPAGATIEALSMQGQRLATLRAQGNRDEVNTSTWAAGTYYLRISQGGKVIFNGKFVKE